MQTCLKLLTAFLTKSESIVMILMCGPCQHVMLLDVQLGTMHHAAERFFLCLAVSQWSVHKRF